jgi:hypothetical protein
MDLRPDRAAHEFADGACLLAAEFCAQAFALRVDLHF